MTAENETEHRSHRQSARPSLPVTVSARTAPGVSPVIAPAEMLGAALFGAFDQNLARRADF